MTPRRFAFVTFCLAGAQFAAAQVPADLAPADSTAFFGWRGIADPGPGYAGSKWENVLKDSQAGRFADETLPAIGAALERRFPQQGQLLHAGVSVVRQAVRKPSGLFLSFNGENPFGGFVCRAGTDSKELTQLLQQLVAQLPPALNAKIDSQDGAVVLTLGQTPTGTTADHLDHATEYQSAVKQGVADPFYVGFVDVKAAIAHAEAAANSQSADAEAWRDGMAIARKFIDASGVGGVSSMSESGGFDQGAWQIDTLVSAAAPRKGFLDTKAPAALDADLAKRIPESANNYSLVAFDAHSALDTLRTIASETDPRARDAIDKAVGGITLAIGKNLDDDLLASFGPQWAAYTSPEVGGTGLSGVVLVNKLTNALKGKQAMTALSIGLSNYARAFIPDKSITVAGRTTRVGNLNVFYVATPVFSPAWAVQDGYLYLALYPQTVVAAAQFSGKPADVAGVAGAIGLGKDAALTGVAVTDPRPSLSEGYGGLLGLSRTVLGLSDVFLTPTPELVVPPLSGFARNADLVRSVSWTDDLGWHQRSVSPYPGAAALGELSLPSTSMITSFMGPTTGALLPLLNRAAGVPQ